MEITAELRGAICILRLRGRFTIGTSEDFERSRTAARICRPSAILIDLKEVPYVDSTGIGYLLSFYATSKRGGEQFGIINLNRRTQGILRICRLDTLLPVFESEEAALAALQAPAASLKSASA